MSSTIDVIALLRKRYPANAYALFGEVQSATAYQGRQRADALAMGLWPSRGIGVIGFEFKHSRGDWLRELKNTDKAEEIFQFCDQWYLVVDGEGIIATGELPQTWGLLAVEGEHLRQAIEAPKLTPKPLCREFVASVLRRAQQETERAEGKKFNERLSSSVQRFERATGISLHDWDEPDKIAHVKRLTARLASDLDAKLRSVRNANLILNGAKVRDLEE